MKKVEVPSNWVKIIGYSISEAFKNGYSDMTYFDQLIHISVLEDKNIVIIEIYHLDDKRSDYNLFMKSTFETCDFGYGCIRNALESFIAKMLWI